MSLERFSRYTKLTGSFQASLKDKRPSHIPYYMEKGVTPVAYDRDDNIINPLPVAMATEAKFAESEPTILPLLGKTPNNIVTLVAGGPGIPAGQADGQIIAEFSRLVSTLVANRRKVILIVQTSLTTEMFGIAGGRYIPMGIFDENESPLWLHPKAVEAGLFPGYAYPGVQKYRTSMTKDEQDAKFLPSWFMANRATAKANTGITDEAALNSAACRLQGGTLHTLGVAPSLEAGTEIAKRELFEAASRAGIEIPFVSPGAPAANAKTTPSTSTAGPAAKPAAKPKAAPAMNPNAAAAKALASKGRKR